MLYVTQVAVRPPTVVRFVNDPTIFDTAFSRFLVNYLREHLPFGEVPIKLIYRRRRRAEERGRP